MMPRKVKKRRQIQTEDGLDAGWEEYFDYVFPQDQGMLVFRDVTLHGPKLAGPFSIEKAKGSIPPCI